MLMYWGYTFISYGARATILASKLGSLDAKIVVIKLLRQTDRNRQRTTHNACHLYGLAMIACSNNV